MHIVFFTHPDFLGRDKMPGFASMPRFARMLADGMQQRGHQVEMWAPQSRFFKLPVSGSLKKWLGYIDQYLLFPVEVRKRLKAHTSDSLFVFTDQALGPWVPLVADRPHVIHCHDFMAQHSALGKIPGNSTSWTGRHYQDMIRKGYSRGKNFISVSNKTRVDLQESLLSVPSHSEVVYNGLNSSLKFYEPSLARETFGKKIALELTSGYLLHVGGNQWYKNRKGVVQLYEAWRALSNSKLPLILIGEKLSPELTQLIAQSPFKADIHQFTGLSDEFVNFAYAGASVFLFPSLAEGFGWPIAEAMACGSLVITTNEAPMTEVAGGASFLIPRKPQDEVAAKAWAQEGAKVVDEVITLPDAERNKFVEAGLVNAYRFNSENILNQIEAIYKRVFYENHTS
ncbi:glycosyltransferase [Hymenobacter sp. HMF4947]|uniref:Glycosyltransferase n=1 Tax=Hymenobacter ginkgonis TaxID=2682976 RepID=A0A7K1TFR2_9BACT|nr:glycosyltransferase [Hymenobacter ginkgonis]MVN77243.1 glycosyltransferase [Hymenobacter ginkgonis]